MACRNKLEIIIGEDVLLTFKFKSENLQFKFGDTLFIVSSISGNNLNCASTSSVTDTLPNLTGTLTKQTGSGDTTLTYTSFATDNFVDLTGMTLIIRAKDDYATASLAGFPITIVANSSNSILTKGTLTYTILNSVTSLLPVGLFLMQMDFVDTNNKVQKSELIEFNIKNSL